MTYLCINLSAKKQSEEKYNKNNHKKSYRIQFIQKKKEEKSYWKKRMTQIQKKKNSSNVSTIIVKLSALVDTITWCSFT